MLKQSAQGHLGNVRWPRPSKRNGKQSGNSNKKDLKVKHVGVEAQRDLQSYIVNESDQRRWTAHFNMLGIIILISRGKSLI